MKILIVEDDYLTSLKGGAVERLQDADIVITPEGDVLKDRNGDTEVVINDDC